MAVKKATRPAGKRRAGAREPSKRLEKYRSMRDLEVTPEPSGTTPPAPAGNRFVVQRHRARRLHYDLRLEMDGVLVSWAVPKGPTLDPKARRLAVHVEDHPLDYFDFEGVIPEREYGGGDVVVWDWGTWSSAKEGDPVQAVADGELHFDLAGEKLAGRFVLVRRDDKSAGKEQWLLLHKNDDAAVPGWDAEEHPVSVKSGRTNDEVAADPSVVWHSDRGDGDGAAPQRRAVPEWDDPSDEGLAAVDALGKNAINKTLVAPFSARPSPDAPVSVPIRWDELEDPDLRPDRWTVRTAPGRLAEVGDPLRALVGLQQHLPDL